MKKLLFIALAASAAVLISCNKELIVDDPVGGEDSVAPAGELVEFSFPAFCEQTKSHIEGLSFVWDDGDEIALCYGSSVQNFKYDAAARTFNGTIDASATGPFYVVSPYRDDISLDGSGEITTTLPGVQCCPTGKFADPAAFVAVGSAADKAALEKGVALKNAFSVVQFTITDPDIAYVAFEGNIESYEAVSPRVAGKVTLNANGIVSSVEGRTTAVTICSESTTMAPGTYTMAILPNEFTNGIKVIYKRDGVNKAYYRVSSSSVSFGRSKGKSFGSVAMADLAKRCYYIQDAYDMDLWNKAAVASDDVVFVGADIDLTGYPMTPVKDFAGTFDGQNHYIYNLGITSGEDAALFASTSAEGSPMIKNVYLGTDDGRNWDGESCIKHSGSTDTDNWMYAGVVGKANGATSILYVFNCCKVMVADDALSKTRIGGICGNWASTGRMYGCFNYGAVRNEATAAGNKNVIGGIVGQADGMGEIDSCFNYGQIVNENDQTSFIGGIVGCTANVESTIWDCVNVGDVYASKLRTDAFGGVGGIVGYFIKGIVSGCFAKDCVVSNAAECDTWKVNTGGIAGYLEAATLKCCVAKDAVVSAAKSYDVGGIAGITENAAKIIDCELSGYTRVIGSQRTGGIVGYMMGKTNTTISGCVVSGAEIEGTLNLGGIAGWLDTGTIEYCTITDGSLINGSGDGVGGIVGRAISKGGTSNLINGCVVDGDALVTGAYSVGGIVGYEYPDANGPVDIYNCGVYKAVVQATSCDTGGDPSKGDCMIGGIAGWVRCKDSASTFKIVNCCMNGEIVCEKDMAHPSAGSMVGYCSLSSAGTGLIANCSTSLTAESLTVNGAPVTSSCTSYGAIVGMLPNHSGISVNNCYYMDGKGLGAGDIGASVVQTNVEAVAEATFKDGTTVPGYLNTYASAYAGYTLMPWKAGTSGFPVIDL